MFLERNYVLISHFLYILKKWLHLLILLPPFDKKMGDFSITSNSCQSHHPILTKKPVNAGIFSAKKILY